MIELKHITKVYGNFKALDDVSVTIRDGEIYGIVGQSGAGKSTLVRCINMLEPPTTGEVLINGKDMMKLSKAELRSERKGIGMIFQHFNLLSSRTVAGNIAFPLELANVPKAEQKKRIDDILEMVGLTEYKDKYPAQLSGGQKQRVGIARAIVSNPSVLLSDEATSALDPETVKSILQLLKDINKKLGITIIMITHQMEVIKEIAERVAVIEHGRIIEEGSVVDLFTNPQTPTLKNSSARSCLRKYRNSSPTWISMPIKRTRTTRPSSPSPSAATSQMNRSSPTSSKSTIWTYLSCTAPSTTSRMYPSAVSLSPSLAMTAICKKRSVI